MERIKERTTSHKNLPLDHIKKSDEGRMNLKDDIENEIRPINEKMNNINDASLYMPKLSMEFSYIRSIVKPTRQVTNTFMTESSHHDNGQLLIQAAHLPKQWPTFTGEGEHDPMSFIKTTDILQEDDAIPD
ncbi:hypothetical protein O181_037663 [Austropuccinia psidii MF-1]|uniref:Uncharacterized protein n=1 Tax=Austropuccinia psidii MF-1 TaxID=1389203 RepID=A0A9Q3HAB4_9BASI|nr:hypothetical protein [Austropuccinia psidii MF-1]